VMICILLSSGASVASSLFLQTLIDDYISPLLIEAVPDFSGLLQVIMSMSAVFLAGVLASLFYSRTMAVIAQSTLKDIRDEMFTKMQGLPIKYFDTRTHGDIMSYYTNDADTLRQMISQSLPNLFSSVVSMVAVFCSMLYLSIWLTLIVVVFTVLILLVIKGIASKSGNYFMKQQTSIADVNGYIEEMINGQKVVKVFCYEENAKERFKVKNENLRENTSMANTLANVLMPVTNGMGYVLYVVIAIAGGAMGIAGVSNFSIGGEAVLTLGTIASFLTLSRNFVNPIAQVSQQLNSVIMAMAGASRIFELLDQQPEEDHGTVTLVNACEGDDGQLTECEKRTGTWAWKDGDKLIPMRGKINLKEVDFGYNEDELVLHDITIYAEPGQKVALVGATGAGKTTITNLINRFYDIDDGKIQYDGININ
ncbi:MAG: ABC transporter ATP-binding protein, partial [Anaerovoracaceae bacterium]